MEFLNQIRSSFQKLANDESGNIAMSGIFALVGVAVGLGILAMVLIIVPGVAGSVYSGMNVTSSNVFYNVTSAVPTNLTSSFNLTTTAALVAVASVILMLILGVFYGISRMGQGQ